MKRIRTVSVWAVLSLLSSVALAEPMGTAFTYQGRLTAGGNAANGLYDLTFRLCDAQRGDRRSGGCWRRARRWKPGLGAQSARNGC